MIHLSATMLLFIASACRAYYRNYTSCRHKRVPNQYLTQPCVLTPTSQEGTMSASLMLCTTKVMSFWCFTRAKSRGNSGEWLPRNAKYKPS